MNYILSSSIYLFFYSCSDGSVSFSLHIIIIVVAADGHSIFDARSFGCNISSDIYICLSRLLPQCIILNSEQENIIPRSCHEKKNYY